MNKRILLVFCFFIGVIMATATLAMAKVTAEEAAKLKTTLTPFGAERAGNEAGTIPAWDGGMTTPPAGYQGPGSRYVNPYESDKILFSINAGNMQNHADNLSSGTQALLQKYSDTFRLDVYPTRRSHAMPEWIYENTLKNATRADLADGGLNVQGAYGGIPFPIPKTGAEIVWNHILRWQGESRSQEYTAYLVTPDSKVLISSGSILQDQYPYYYKDGSLETFEGDFFLFFNQYLQPSRRKGEIQLVRDPVDMANSGRRAWQYLTGQRRVRMAPTIAFDTPNPSFSGTVTFDEAWLFNGSLERYDWKIVGKKEMLIPYNCYKALDRVSPTTKYKKGHINPDYLRWEIHRVWVVEGNLKSGHRHSYAKRVFMIDEDSWVLILADSYDGQLKLWRTNMGVTTNAYDLPGVVYFQNLHSDLLTGHLSVNFDPSDHKRLPVYNDRKPEDYFLPDQIRRFGN
ncbi:MAG: DUF1329 domain-containing protein [Desulfobacterales bacterium]|jgi:hypothetical protein|nr:DUF1329 domain-containing protein [Desulfobacterales bacterium]